MFYYIYNFTLNIFFFSFIMFSNKLSISIIIIVPLHGQVNRQVAFFLFFVVIYAGSKGYFKKRQHITEMLHVEQA